MILIDKKNSNNITIFLILKITINICWTLSSNLFENRNKNLPQFLKLLSRRGKHWHLFFSHKLSVVFSAITEISFFDGKDKQVQLSSLSKWISDKSKKICQIVKLLLFTVESHSENVGVPFVSNSGKYQKATRTIFYTAFQLHS